MRQGECLGLTWDAIDFDADRMSLEWQLQPLPYIDRKNKALGFRVPNDFEAKHLVDAYHLVRPKSKAGVRTFPLIKPLRDALLEWREVAPENPWGLVWPTLDGRPANNKHDLREWHALQGTACVGHPGGRYYHVHEARNLTATQLEDLKAGDSVITSLLGHASIITSRGYMRAHDEGKRAVLEALGERLFIPND
jgi:integrase